MLNLFLDGGENLFSLYNALLLFAEYSTEVTLCGWRSVRQTTDAVSSWISRVLVFMALSAERILQRLQVIVMHNVNDFLESFVTVCSACLPWFLGFLTSVIFVGYFYVFVYF